MRAHQVTEIAPGVYRAHGGARTNVYLVRSGSSWVLVETGWRGGAAVLRQSGWRRSRCSGWTRCRQRFC